MSIICFRVCYSWRNKTNLTSHLEIQITKPWFLEKYNLQYHLPSKVQLLPRSWGRYYCSTPFPQTWHVYVPLKFKTSHMGKEKLCSNFSGFKVFHVWMQYKCEVHPRVWPAEHFLPLKRWLRNSICKSKRFFCKKVKRKVTGLLCIWPYPKAFLGPALYHFWPKWLDNEQAAALNSRAFSAVL